MQETKSVKFSKTTITELMIPSYANFGGKIHGGILLSLIDKVAYVCAAKHAGTYCVTVSVDNVEFLQPVEVGELVSLHASVNYVGNTSLVVGIKVTAENVKLGLVKHTNTCYVTMVAKNESGNKIKVPELILESKDEVRRFVMAMKRKELKLGLKDSLNYARRHFKLEGNEQFLKSERCCLNL